LKRSVLKYIVLGGFLTFSAVFQAQVPTCVDDGILKACKIAKLLKSTDGLIHVKYATLDAAGNRATAGSPVNAAIQDGTAKWNSLKQTTGVIFEPAAQNETPNITFAPSSSYLFTGGCASMAPTSGTGYWSTEFEQLATSAPANASAIIAHELGHFLGLYEAGFNPMLPTIMNNGLSCTPEGSDTPTKSPLLNDASVAQVCTKKARDMQPVTLQSGGTVSNANAFTMCNDYYDVYIYGFWGSSSESYIADTFYVTEVAYVYSYSSCPPKDSALPEDPPVN
jgi:hypothetical protein